MESTAQLELVENEMTVVLVTVTTDVRVFGVTRNRATPSIDCILSTDVKARSRLITSSRL